MDGRERRARKARSSFHWPCFQNSGHFSGLTGTIAMSLDSVRGWFLRPGASDLEVTVAAGADAEQTLQAVRNAVKLGSGDGAFRWGRKRSRGDISTLVAATVAWLA